MVMAYNIDNVLGKLKVIGNKVEKVNENLAVVRDISNGRYRVISLVMDELVESKEYDEIIALDDSGYLLVREENKWGILRGTDDLIVFGYKSLSDPVRVSRGGYNIIASLDRNYVGVINEKNDIIIPFNVGYLRLYEASKYIYVFKNSEDMKIYNEDGLELALDIRSHEFHYICKDFILVCDHKVLLDYGRCEFYDFYGRKICEYDDVIMHLEKGGKFRLFNRKMKPVTDYIQPIPHK